MPETPNTGSDLFERAQKLIDLADGDPRRAIEDGTAVMGAAVVEGDLRTQSLALRAMGLAARNLKDVEESRQLLERAVATAEDAGEASLAAKARVTLAPTLLYLGEPQAAFDQLRIAERDLEDVDRAKAQMQRGGILARQSRFAAAVPVLTAAIGEFAEHGEDVWRAHALANRGIVQGYVGDVEAAHSDLSEARELYRATGHDVSVAEMTHGLGWVAALAGDFHAAMRLFDEAAAEFERLDFPFGALLLDRSEALLGVGLAAESAAVSSEALRAAEFGGMAVDEPECLLLLAQALHLAESYQRAAEAANRAASDFEVQERPGWAAHARYVAIRARFAGGMSDPADLPAALEVAEVLRRADLVFPATHASLIAGRLAARRGDNEVAIRELERVGSATQGPVELRVQGAVARANLLLLRGNPAGAARTAAAGVSMLKDYQAALGAVDARAGVARFGDVLCEMGLSLAAAAGRPRRLLEWSERRRSLNAAQRPVAPPASPRLARMTAELRSVNRQVDSADVDPELGRALRRRETRLQQLVRMEARSQSRSQPAPDELPVTGLVPSNVCLVSFEDVGGEYVAVVVDRGRSGLRRLGPTQEVLELIDSNRFAVNRLLQKSSETPGARAARQMLDDTTARIDAAVFQPLRLDADRRTVFVPTAPLAGLPWSGIPSLLEIDFVVAASLDSWARSNSRRGGGDGRVVVVNGPGLDEGASEARDVARVHRDVSRFTARSGRVDPILSALEGASVAHLATHGVFSPENPLFSGLVLADGLLTMYDLDRIEAGPGTVVLSGCQGGLSSASAGTELLGLVNGFLARGSRSVIASTTAVLDTAATRRFMGSLHEELAVGAGGAAALREARRRARAESSDPLTYAGFTCFGAGW